MRIGKAFALRLSPKWRKGFGLTPTLLCIYILVARQLFVSNFFLPLLDKFQIFKSLWNGRGIFIYFYTRNTQLFIIQVLLGADEIMELYT